MGHMTKLVQLFAMELKLAASRVNKYNEQRSRLEEDADDPGPYALQGFQRAVCMPGYPSSAGHNDGDKLD